MALQVHNVRTRRKEPFTPLRPTGPIGMYVCGLTVYDHAHIGHARTYVAFEVIRRWLEHSYPGRLRYVKNVTDVEDKILARAKERGVSPRAHAAEWDERCLAQLRRLGVRDPDEAPHVTQSVPGIITFIQGIVANGFAYATAQGNVYFDVPGYDAHAAEALADAQGRACGYGSLSNRDYREMAAGTRKDVEGDKRHPADFALWKCADSDDHRDANWESPWGRGRPGWHIECSHMATEALGEQVDLHGGGQDLIFPHHENEVAQSQAKTGKAPFSSVWMHTGFLNVEGEKMSKSLGNFVTIEGMLDELDARHGAGRGAELLRFYFLQTHYRSRIDFNRKGLDEAATAIERLHRTRTFLADAAARHHPGTQAPAMGCADLDVPLADAGQRAMAAFATAMDDDFHTPGALAALFDLQRACNAALDGARPGMPLGAAAARQALETLESLAGHLTLLQAASARPGDAGVARPVPAALAAAAARLAVLLPADGAGGLEAAMEAMLAARLDARKAKDWPRSDAIRAAAASAGYAIEDTPQGQRWRAA